LDDLIENAGRIHAPNGILTCDPSVLGGQRPCVA